VLAVVVEQAAAELAVQAALAAAERVDQLARFQQRALLIQAAAVAALVMRSRPAVQAAPAS
jgi:hypothetical protein